MQTEKAKWFNAQLEAQKLRRAALAPEHLALKRRLRKARRARRMTLSDVGRAIGVTRQAVGLWEAVHRPHLPSRENTLALAKLFGLSVEELTFDATPTESPPVQTALPLPVAPSAPVSGVDETLLQEILEAVLDEARNRGIPLSHDRLARSAAAIYHTLRSGDQRAILPVLSAHTLRLAS